MKCINCENTKSLTKEIRTIKYTECGLDNVVLIGVEYHHCAECGEEYFGYKSLENLHVEIAKILLRKHARLTGHEVRFLRKHLGYSGALFAKLIAYKPETLSRIENEKQPVDVSFDRLIRFVIINKMPDRHYDLHDQLLNAHGVHYKRIEMVHFKGSWKSKLAA